MPTRKSSSRWCTGFFSRRTLVYHLHDILSADHFSRTNRRLAVTLPTLCITSNSKLQSQAAFVAAGRPDIADFVYNGFDIEFYQNHRSNPDKTAARMRWAVLVGHFSRLSPWKGQHVLLEALCPSL